MKHDLSFCELRCKQVVNVIDGKVLGRISDVMFSRTTAKVIGFCVPGGGGFPFFSRRGEIFIPYERICKIGLDVILVELKPLHHGHHRHGEVLEIGHPPHGEHKHGKRDEHKHK